MGITRFPFGTLPDGAGVEKYTLTNASGANVSILTYGGTLCSLCVPDKDGRLVDVCLGYDNVSDYLRAGGYLGALVGRYANRIANARFPLGGVDILLDANDRGNALHGGLVGFDKKIWAAQTLEEEGQDSLILSLTSPDGDAHFPGTLQVTVTYTFNDDDELAIHYHATTDKDTVCNLTNHAYFNLAGHNSGSISEHFVQINADAFTVIDAQAIPTGELRDVTDTAFDLRSPVRLADCFKAQDSDEQMRNGGGFDHNFVLCDVGEGISKAAEVYSTITGIRMETFTDMPGVQFYSGNKLQIDFPAKDERRYEPRDGLCLETQYFPDTPNHPEFPSCLLRPGEAYDSTTVYKFSVLDD